MQKREGFSRYKAKIPLLMFKTCRNTYFIGNTLRIEVCVLYGRYGLKYTLFTLSLTDVSIS